MSEMKSHAGKHQSDRIGQVHPTRQHGDSGRHEQKETELG
jgi:hypothetical protein